MGGRRADHFVWTMHNLKRGCPPLPKSLVKVAMEKHKNTLTKVTHTPIEILVHVEKVVKEMLRDYRPDNDLSAPVSRHSCTERTRIRGGAQSFLSDQVYGVSSMSLRKAAIINSYGQKHRVDVRNRILHSTMTNEGPQPVRVTCVDDACKARIITIESSNNSILKSVTTSLNRFIGSRPQFQLIRGARLSDLLKDEVLDEGKFWVSGDYTSATDNLNKDLTDVVGGVILRKLPWELQDCYKQNYGKHLLVYPDGEEIVQTNGQLMGSLSSFNNLCLINFGVYDYCRSKMPSEFSEWVKINGDDIAFQATRNGFEYWKTVVGSCGLVSTQGKSYLSANYCTINSELHRMDTRSRIGFVNFSNLMGKLDQKDSDTFRSKETLLENIGSIARAFRESLSDSYSTRSIELFESKYKKILKGKELWVPIPFGGLGGKDIKTFIAEGGNVRPIVKSKSNDETCAASRATRMMENELCTYPGERLLIKTPQHIFIG